MDFSFQITQKSVFRSPTLTLILKLRMKKETTLFWVISNPFTVKNIWASERQQNAAGKEIEKLDRQMQDENKFNDFGFQK